MDASRPNSYIHLVIAYTEELVTFTVTFFFVQTVAYR